MDCKNCSSTIGVNAKFCSECGQSIVSYNRPLRPVLTDMLHESLDIDGRLLNTLKTLLFKPGQLSVAYRQGQRARYTPPLRLYLVISIIFFLLLPLLEAGSQVASDTAPLRTDLYPKIMFVLLPFFALLLHALFKGSYYLSSLVFAIHIHCIAYLAIGFMLPLEAQEATHPIFIVLQLPFLLYLLAYIPLALKRYYAQSWAKIGIKSVVLFLVYASTLGIAFDYALKKLV